MRLKHFLITLFIGMQMNQQVYGQGQAANPPAHPLKPVIESLVKKENIDNYCTLKQIWQLITFPAKNSSGNGNLSTVLNNYCSNQLVMYERDSKQLQIRPTDVGKSVLDGRATAFYLLNMDGDPIPHVVVQRMANSQQARTDKQGIVVFEHLTPGEELSCKQTFTTGNFLFRFTGQPCSTITLPPKVDSLDSVVNTGYYSYDKYTGKTFKVSLPQLHISNDNHIIPRLQAVAPNLLNVRPSQYLLFPSTGTFRTPNTINGKRGVLVVVNGVPCLHPELINPNDVQQVVIAMDPITMSQYGTRAANGVILITLNKPSGAPISVNHYSSIGITPSPRQFAQRYLSASEYLDQEISLFNDSAYNQRIAGNKSLSPAVEVLRAHREGKLSTSAKDSILAGFRSRDLQKSLLREWYRPAVNQQHFVSVSSNLKNISLYGSFGFDRILFPEKRERYTRKTLQLSTSITYSGVTYTANLSMAHADKADNRLNFPSRIPYLTLRDGSGKAVAIPYGNKAANEDSATAAKLYPREYVPSTELELLDHTYRNELTTLLQKLNVRITRGIEITGFLQYGTYSSVEQNLHDSNSYFVRNTMNTNASMENNVVKWRLPSGAIHEIVKSNTRFTDGRIQMNLRPFTRKNNLLVIAGTEFQTNKTTGESYTVYGYTTTARQVKSGPGLDTTDNYAGIFSSINYTYKDKITISGSFRKDYLNAYGPKSIFTAPSFFSLGASIQLANLFRWPEEHPTAILRINMGRSGTTNYQVHRYTTIKDGVDNNYGEPLSYITSTRNAHLSPEQLNMIDFGLDVENYRKTIWASISFYRRDGKSLWSSSRPNPVMGIAEIPSNNNQLRGKGIDFYASVKYGPSDWSHETVFWLSAATNKVVSAFQSPEQNAQYMNPTVIALQQGQPVYSMYAFRTAGLDKQTGNLVGYYKNSLSVDYNSIMNTDDTSAIRYMGSAIPTSYARLTHTLRLPYGLQVQVGIMGKFNYYYRRTTYSASGILDGTNAHIDFKYRWQKPGDELYTNIPSFSTENMYERDFVNQYSDRYVKRADHIKLEYIKLSWQKLNVWKIQELELGLLMSSNVLLWSKEGLGQDPELEQSGVIIPSSFSLNINIKI